MQIIEIETNKIKRFLQIPFLNVLYSLKSFQKQKILILVISNYKQS